MAVSMAERMVAHLVDWREQRMAALKAVAKVLLMVDEKDYTMADSLVE